jgi:hypothetical protein
MAKKKVTVYFLKKKRDINGNPIYHVFIPEVTGKQKGLRSLKTPHMYSFSSYNINEYMKYFGEKNNYTVKVYKHGFG